MQLIDIHPDWWKWGTAEKRKVLTDYPNLKAHLEQRWNVGLNTRREEPANFPVVANADNARKLEILFGAFSFTANPATRLVKSLGKSYKDLLFSVSRTAVQVVDGVIYPQSHEEVQRILEIASREGVLVMPFGGGSNVCGDFDLPGADVRPRLAMDMAKMNALLQLDKVNHKATFQGGIYGPALEQLLHAQGFTLGHFPQSFEYSTLGGWVVTRSAGQESSGYGRIEDIAIAIKVATPTGTLQTSNYEGDAAGVNLKGLYFGSEGMFGVVTEVSVRIHPLPKTKQWAIGLFPNYQSGLNALQSLVQQNIFPTVVRYSDEHETFFLSLLSHEAPGFVANLKAAIKSAVLKYKKLEKGCIMMVRFEDDCGEDCPKLDKAKRAFSDNGAMLLGDALGKKWEGSRFGLPYLRDDMMLRNIVVDTMETVVPWNKIDDLRKKLRLALDTCTAFRNQQGILLAHVSHVYTSCASIYFTVLTPMEAGNEMAQWREIKKTVTDTIVNNGGAVSHHHGVGKDHQPWYLQTTDEVTKRILQSIKQAVDPANILNPGKLFDEA